MLYWVLRWYYSSYWWMLTLTEFKITYSRHAPYKIKIYSTLIYGNTVPFRITAFWWVSILFTTLDNSPHFVKIHHTGNSPQQKNSPHYKKIIFLLILFFAQFRSDPRRPTTTKQQAHRINQTTHTHTQIPTIYCIFHKFLPFIVFFDLGLNRGLCASSNKLLTTC